MGERTAELMKMQIGCVFPKEQETSIEIKGRCLVTGLPKVINVSSVSYTHLDVYKRQVYILDEPTTGLHADDVRKLLEVLQRLTDGGNTVLGSSRIYTVRPVARRLSSVASLTRWASPPERVVLGWPSFT